MTSRSTNLWLEPRSRQALRLLSAPHRCTSSPMLHLHPRPHGELRTVLLFLPVQTACEMVPYSPRAANSGDAPVSHRRAPPFPASSGDQGRAAHSWPSDPARMPQIRYPLGCVTGARWTRGPGPQLRPRAASAPRGGPSQSVPAVWHHVSQAAPLATLLHKDPTKSRNHDSYVTPRPPKPHRPALPLGRAHVHIARTRTHNTLLTLSSSLRVKGLTRGWYGWWTMAYKLAPPLLN
jgi:hypothetical protein